MSTWAKLCQAFYACFFTLHDWNQDQLWSEKIHALCPQSCCFDFSFRLRMTRNSLRILSFLRVANAFFWFAPIPSEGWRTMSLTLVEGLCSDGRFRSKHKPTTKTNTAHTKQGVAWPMYPNPTIFPIADLYRNYFRAVCLHLETTKTCMHQVTPDSFRSLDLDRFRWITYCDLINSLCYVARPCLEDLQCQSCSVREALVWTTTGKRW